MKSMMRCTCSIRVSRLLMLSLMMMGLAKRPQLGGGLQPLEAFCGGWLLRCAEVVALPCVYTGASQCSGLLWRFNLLRDDHDVQRMGQCDE